MKQLFKLKSRNLQLACVIYEGVCVFEQTYIGKVGCNIELWWEEHENITNDFKPAKYLKENHKFSWKMFSAPPENKQICKILEASKIALKRPSLNQQIKS